MLNMPNLYVFVKHIWAFYRRKHANPLAGRQAGPHEGGQAHSQSAAREPRANQVTGYTTTASIATALRALR